MTKEEYIRANTTLGDGVLCIPRYSEPKFDCPKCGGGMCKDNMKVLASRPPKFEYICDKCGHVEYLYV